MQPSVTALNLVEKTRSEHYAKLADHFLSHLNLKRVHRILEAGCGRGQLTLPLFERLPKRISLVAVDSSRGSYAGWLTTLKSSLQSNPEKSRVRLIQSDVSSMGRVGSGSVDVVVSNELLCDLKNEAQVLKVFKEFHRVLRPGGVMIHGEWASEPTNPAQEITIRADSPEATDSPGRFWNPDELFELNRMAGFHRVSVSYLQTSMSFGYEVAVKELRDWGVRESFLRRSDKLLRRYGIQFPFEHVIKSQKRSR